MQGYETRLQYLYQQFVNDTASAAEIEEFWQLLEDADDDDLLKESVFKLYEDRIPQPIEKKNWDGALDRILHRQDEKGARQAHRAWWWAAASILLVASTFSYFFFLKGNTPPQQLAADSKPIVEKDVSAPEKNTAMLTLSDGTRVYLDSSNNGMLARQADAEINKTDDGKIIYLAKSGKTEGRLLFNTLTNPRGSRVLTLTLSDGSRVWLNADSYIRFPVSFTGNERRVSVQGEAYLEVAHDSRKKFFVEAAGATTEVLGTHFNVNAYRGNGGTRVTLLEGSVKVTSGNSANARLRPGQQAVMEVNGEILVKNNVNVDEVMAWKNEMFHFNDTNIKDIMAEVARWYDVDIDYRGNTAGLNFGGIMSRQNNVSELLKRLEATGAVRFDIAGRTIHVVKTE